MLCRSQKRSKRGPNHIVLLTSCKLFVINKNKNKKTHYFCEYTKSKVKFDVFFHFQHRTFHKNDYKVIF